MVADELVYIGLIIEGKFIYFETAEGECFKCKHY